MLCRLALNGPVFPLWSRKKKLSFWPIKLVPKAFPPPFFSGISPGNEVAFWPYFMNPSFIYQPCSVKLARNCAWSSLQFNVWGFARPSFSSLSRYRLVSISFVSVAFLYCFRSVCRLFYLDFVFV